MKASLLKEEFKTNKYDEMLKDLYEDASLVDYQKDRYANALDKFVELYSDENVSIYSAQVEVKFQVTIQTISMVVYSQVLSI